MAKSSRLSLQLVQWHVDWTIQNYDVRAELNSLFLLCQTCLEAAIHNPSFVECRLGFRVFCAFAVFFLVFR